MYDKIKYLYEDDSLLVVEEALEINFYEKKSNGLISFPKGVSEEFFEKKDFYIKAFQSYWSIDDSVLNYKLKSLETLDTIIFDEYDDTARNKIKWTRVSCSKLSLGFVSYLDIPLDAVWGLIAYIGEVIIHETDGYWTSREMQKKLTEVKRNLYETNNLSALIFDENIGEFRIERGEQKNTRQKTKKNKKDAKEGKYVFKAKIPLVVGSNGFRYDFFDEILDLFSANSEFFIYPRIANEIKQSRR
jgi:hypothetical protein